MTTERPCQSDTLQAHLDCAPVALFVISILTILGIAAVTFATDGGGFSGSDWLVGLGFGAMSVAFASPVLVALLATVASVKRRSSSNTK